MKDKEKQIEEMAKLIDDRLIEARGYLGSMNKGEGYWIAQKLVEHYQPKIMGNSVMLTKEELNEKYVLIGALVQVKEELEFIKRRNADTNEKIASEIADYVAKARKETAEKFYKDIHDIIKKSDGFLCEEVLRITAKQFGVEIKE